MTRLISRKPIVFILAVIIIVSVSSLAVPTSKIMADGISVGTSPTAVDDFISSGSSKTYIITVNSNSVIDMEVGGLGELPSGVMIEVPEQNDTSPFTARPWVSLNQNQLEPGDNQTFSITVNVPPGTTPGEYYASVLLQTEADGSDITSSILIPITLTVDNSSFTPDLAGQIADLSVPAVDQGEPVNFLITLSDTGNCPLSNANADVNVKDMFQNVIWQSNISLSGPPMLPYYPRLIDVVYSTGLNVGSYTITSDFTLPNGTLDSKTVAFTVGEGPRWDINGDGVCNIYDLVLLGNYWGETGAPGWIPEDINQDGFVNIYDLVILGNHWGETW